MTITGVSIMAKKSINRDILNFLEKNATDNATNAVSLAAIKTVVDDLSKAFAAFETSHKISDEELKSHRHRARRMDTILDNVTNKRTMAKWITIIIVIFSTLTTGVSELQKAAINRYTQSKDSNQKIVVQENDKPINK